MPEVMRSFAARLREFIGNHRRAPRHRARLPLNVSLVNNGSGARTTTMLQGHTRDVSATGLALVVPSIRIGDRYLTGENRTLDIALDLASGRVQLQAAPMRYEPLELDKSKTETGYLIGAHIKAMSGTDRARFSEYLQGLR
jgi:hypothetical protein